MQGLKLPSHQGPGGFPVGTGLTTPLISGSYLSEHDPSPPMQADIMHLTDAAVRRQLFLDVLDGTKALVSRPVAVPFPLVT